MVNCMTGQAPWAGLLADAQVAAVFGPAHQIALMRQFEVAWTRALGATGAVPMAQAERAAVLLDEMAVDTAALAVQTQVDGVPVPELVRQMRAAVGPDLAGAVHTGATSQDVLDTCMVLSLRAVAGILEARVAVCLARLDVLAADHGAAPLMARTRMQAALPINVADRVAVWHRSLSAARNQVASAAEAVAQVQVAGPVGVRDGAAGPGEAMAAAMAQALDLRPGPPWHTDRSAVAGFGHALVGLAAVLGKIGQDVALMAQQGVGAARLSGGGTSSAMAHKVNPVAAEGLVSLHRVAAGQQAMLLGAGVHEQERSGVAWSVEFLVLPALCEAVGCASRQAVRLLESVEALGDAVA